MYNVTMKILIEDFKKARRLVIQAVKDFPEDRRKEILFDEWDLKDLLAHMSGWMVSATDNVKHVKKGKIPPWVGGIDDFNKESVEKRKNWGWNKVYKEILKTSEDFIKEYESLPSELERIVYWSGRNFTPKKILEIEIKHWKITHLHQITKIS